MSQVSKVGRLGRGLAAPLTLIEAFESWLKGNLDQVRQREQALKLVETRGGHWLPGGEFGSLPLVWRLFGAKPVSYFFVSGEAFTEADCARIEQLFPEAQRVARLAVSVATMNAEAA